MPLIGGDFDLSWHTIGGGNVRIGMSSPPNARLHVFGLKTDGGTTSIPMPRPLSDAIQKL